MSRETVELAKSLHLHNGPDGMTADSLIILRGENAVLRGRLATALADLDAANERARAMAIDLRRYALMNDRQARIISELNHTNDELRYQMRLAARADMGQAMTALLNAALNADITDIARDYADGEISLQKAVTLATTRAEGIAAMRNRRPLTLTDRGSDGDGYCAYADMVME